MAAVAVIVAAVLLVGPLRGTRSDIAQQKRDVHRQLSVTRHQLKAIQEQRTDLEKQLEVTKRQLDIVSRQLRVAEKQERLTMDLVSMQRRLLQTLELQRRLLEVAEATLREVREINGKIPPPS